MVAVRMGCLRCRFDPVSCSKAVDLVVNPMDCRMVADLTEGNSMDWRDSMVTMDLMVDHRYWVVFAGTGSQVPN